MFKVLRDGANYTNHSTYEEACKKARMAAHHEKGVAFLVCDAEDTISNAHYKAIFSEGKLVSYPLGVECVP